MNKISTTEKVNKNYYDKIYSSNFGSLFNLVKTLTSYDQQSKSKLNIYFIKKYLNQSKKITVLDYGFGRGSLLLKMPKNVNLIGCEISDSAVQKFPKIAKIIGKNVSTCSPEEFDSRVKDNSVDIIFCSHVLEHVPDDLKLLKTFKNKVKPNGYVLINIPINEVWNDPKHVRKYTFENFKRIAHDQGLSVIESFETNQLDNFILTHEIIKRKSIFKKYSLKILRLIFALMPLKFLLFVNLRLSRNYKPAQLICILQKIY